MEQELITEEIAILAREKGFNTYSLRVYQYVNGYELVPQTLLQRWLREKHNIIVEIRYVYGITNKDTKYDYILFNCVEEDDLDIMPKFNTFEKALEVALKEALTLIKIEIPWYEL
jgi:hypothetical protein